MQGLRFKPDDCTQPGGICVKTSLGQMVLPSTNCSCAKGMGPGRVTIPPIVWIVVGLGVLLYAWLNNWTILSLAWQTGQMGNFVMDLANLFLALNFFGLVLLWGAYYEYAKRKKELDERRPSLSCEQEDQ